VDSDRSSFDKYCETIFILLFFNYIENRVSEYLGHLQVIELVKSDKSLQVKSSLLFMGCSERGLEILNLSLWKNPFENLDRESIAGKITVNFV
jgi:hypothetical protein